MPADVEKAVKVLEKKPEIESPWGLVTYLRKKGYKMPAAEKYKLPSPKEEKELDSYDKHITDKEHALKKLYGKADLSQEAQKKFKKKLSEELEKRDSELKLIPRKASEKKETPTLPKMHRDYITSPESLLDDWKPGATLPKVRTAPYAGKHASEIMDMFIAEEKEGLLDKIKSGVKDLISSPKVKSYEKPTPLTKMFVRRQFQKAEEESKRPAGPIDVSKGAPPGFIVREHKKAEEESDERREFRKTDDPLVFPDEYKMGLKEETEHADVTGGDKEATKKIVLAHLAEDPHYYTKLGTVMKAEEELSPFRHVDVKTDPKGQTYKRKNVPGSTLLWNVPKEKRVGDKQAINVHEKKAEEEDQLKWTPKPPKPKPVEPLKQSPRDEIESFLHLHQKAEEERRQSPIRRSMKGVPHEKDVVRHLRVIDPVEKKAEEETQYRPTEPEHDTTKWERDQYEQKSKPLLKRVSEKLFGEKAEEDVHGPTPDVGKISLPSEKDWAEAKVYKEKLSDKLSKLKGEEDQTSDYIESLSKRKLPGWSKPRGPKPETEKDLPSERFGSKELVQKAGEELNEPKKVFDEDALNELYMFLQWMSDGGFKAEDGDKLEEYMDRYSVEKFAEEAAPPAEFKAPDGNKCGV